MWWGRTEGEGTEGITKKKGVLFGGYPGKLKRPQVVRKRMVLAQKSEILGPHSGVI